jgi:hypothetical protein
MRRTYGSTLNLYTARILEIILAAATIGVLSLIILKQVVIAFLLCMLTAVGVLLARSMYGNYDRFKLYLERSERAQRSMKKAKKVN